MKGAGASSRSLMYHVLCFEMKPARLPNRWSPALRSGDSALISSHSPSDYEGLFLADRTISMNVLQSCRWNHQRQLSGGRYERVLPANTGHSRMAGPDRLRR